MLPDAVVSRRYRRKLRTAVVAKLAITLHLPQRQHLQHCG
jgi:hypothetical protein